MKTTTEVLRSLVADIEAMKSVRPDIDAGRIEDGAYSEGCWFGGFEVGWYEDRGTGATYIQWPNLGILLEEAKQALSDAEDLRRHGVEHYEDN